MGSLIFLFPTTMILTLAGRFFWVGKTPSWRWCKQDSLLFVQKVGLSSRRVSSEAKEKEIKEKQIRVKAVLNIVNLLKKAYFVIRRGFIQLKYYGVSSKRSTSDSETLPFKESVPASFVIATPSPSSRGVLCTKTFPFATCSQ